jgi:carbamoyltransferase
MTKILGISCYYHDSAAVLLDDGKIVTAAEEERFSRIKHDSGFPEGAIDFCLSEGKVKPKELDFVVFYEKPYVKFERILKQTLATFPQSRKFFLESMREWLTKKLWIRSQIAERLGILSSEVYFSDHHMSHAASAFYPSPFKEAAILTLDGVGEWSVASCGVGKDNKIEIWKEMRFPHSLGLLYSVFTAFLGFQVNEGEYKVMGMAPYGVPRFIKKIKKIVEIYADGSIKLDLDYFSFHSNPDKNFNEKFIKLFGKPRSKDELFFTEKTGYPRFWGEKPKNYIEKAKVNQKYADIAASIQKITEEIILKICNNLYKETGLSNLCMAGGVALNSVANGKIVTETPFKYLWIQPAAGDSGGALGAALYLYHHVLGNKKRIKQEHSFFGKSYSKADVKRAISPLIPKGQALLITPISPITLTEYKNDKLLIKNIAKALTQKKVVGWFEGRFEWGPRALGHRSILADPRDAKMKDVVNAKIKFREPYRPFAPAVLQEKAKDYFEIDDPASGPAKFMIIVIPTKKGKEKVIPAVSHEGTSRIQSVDSQTHPRYYQLIKEFGKLTGVPVIMNTSFNLRGEPIVNSPEDAINTFVRSGIDILVMERFVIEKKGAKRQRNKGYKVVK